MISTAVDISPQAILAHLRNLNQPARQPGREFSFSSWKERGACHTSAVDTADFYNFPIGREDYVKHIAMLRNLCLHSCPVLDECRKLGAIEEFGFLAGMTEDERRRQKGTDKRNRYKERVEAGLVAGPSYGKC